MSILIIDFIEESTKNIVSFFLTKGVDVVVLSPIDPLPRNKRILGIVCTGSEQMITTEDHQLLPEYVFRLNVPLMCICYSSQLIIEKFSNTFERHRMSGQQYLDDGTLVWTNYNIGVTSIPYNFRIVNTFKGSNYIASFESRELDIVCYMFHPERRHGDTIYNIEYFERFFERIMKK